MMTPDQERECIQRARTDARAFAPLYDHYFARVHAYVCYRVYDPQDAEDVIADVFLKAIQNLQRFCNLSLGFLRFRLLSHRSRILFQVFHPPLPAQGCDP